MKPKPRRRERTGYGHAALTAFRMATETRERVEAIARERSVCVSMVLRELIGRGLEREGDRVA